MMLKQKREGKRNVLEGGVVDVLLLLLVLVLVLVEAIDVVVLVPVMVLVVVLSMTIAASGLEVVSLTVSGLSKKPKGGFCPNRCCCAAVAPGTADQFAWIRSASFA